MLATRPAWARIWYTHYMSTHTFSVVRAVVFAAMLAAIGFFALNAYLYKEKQAPVAESYLDAEYLIEGARVTLSKDGATRLFGNELMSDLDGDGDEDVAFILTQARGEELLFYAVAALRTERGYVGSDGYLLGDRVAPQPTTLSPNPRHVRVVVFNYAARAPGEPMATPPSMGESVYLKIDADALRWGIVLPDFEGEAR